MIIHQSQIISGSIYLGKIGIAIGLFIMFYASYMAYKDNFKTTALFGIIITMLILIFGAIPVISGYSLITVVP